jgi:hypothetical protein
MKCDSRVSFLAHTFASPCFCNEPKARVAIVGVDGVCMIGLVDALDGPKDVKLPINLSSWEKKCFVI